ncbi:redoxin domain-containing protein [Streptomyces sp. CC208A]|uniref:redoxin domain-containing protein n=1 Tax=Streptomyces sp. CC208A TaxID=3044573 RepID=UPI0024A86C87|nr:redoxin domain-containing protein [Streptomyces sp. CC208A]
MPARHARRVPLAALAAVLAVAVAACGRSTQEPAGAHAPPTAGTPAKLAFAASTLDSKPFEGVTLAGKPAVLWFWEPACGACGAQAPEVAMTADLYEGQVNVLGVAGGGGDALHRAFVDSTGTRHVRHLSDPGKEVWNRFDVSTPGEYVLLDRGGEVVARGAELEGRLAKEVAPLVR